MFLFTAMKLGASGWGISMWLSSTPFEVRRKMRSPTTSGELVARLWGKTVSSSIMSSTQMKSPSILSWYFSWVKGPSFSPSRKPSTSAQISSQRFET